MADAPTGFDGEASLAALCPAASSTLDCDG